jgi:hypothetical protein
MNEYIVTLKEWYSNQVFHDLKDFGVEVIWVSQALPHIIAVRTNKTIEEIQKLYYVEDVWESVNGTLFK